MFFRSMITATFIAFFYAPSLAALSPQALWDFWEENAEKWGGTLSAEKTRKNDGTMLFENIEAGFNLSLKGVLFFHANAHIPALTLSPIANDGVELSGLDEISGNVALKIKDMSLNTRRGSGTTMAEEFIFTADFFASSQASKVIYHRDGDILTSKSHTPEIFYEFFAVFDDPESDHATHFALEGREKNVRVNSQTNMKMPLLDFSMNRRMDSQQIIQETRFKEEGENFTEEQISKQQGAHYTIKVDLRDSADFFADMGSLWGAFWGDDAAHAGNVMEDFDWKKSLALLEGDSFEVSMNMSIDQGSEIYKAKNSEGEDSFELSYRLAAGDFELTDEGVEIDSDAKDIEMRSTGAFLNDFFDFAFGLKPEEKMELTLGRAEFGLALPFGPINKELAFSHIMTLADFRLSEEIWHLIDPDAKLAHSPFTFLYDIGAKYHFHIPIFDLIKREVEDQPLPPFFDIATLKEVTLNRFMLKGFSSVISALGRLDPTTQPSPSGQLRMRTIGLKETLRNMTRAGWLSPEMSLAAFNMLDLYAAPQSANKKALSFEFEFSKDGSVKINGTPVN